MPEVMNEAAMFKFFAGAVNESKYPRYARRTVKDERFCREQNNELILLAKRPAAYFFYRKADIY